MKAVVTGPEKEVVAALTEGGQQTINWRFWWITWVIAVAIAVPVVGLLQTFIGGHTYVRVVNWADRHTGTDFFEKPKVYFDYSTPSVYLEGR